MSEVLQVWLAIKFRDTMKGTKESELTSPRSHRAPPPTHTDALLKLQPDPGGAAVLPDALVLLEVEEHRGLTAPSGPAQDRSQMH